MRLKITNLSQKIHKVYSTEIGRWVIAALVSAATILTVFICVQPVFMTIDDAKLLYVYAGYTTGIPEANYLFTYYPLGWLISKLYTFFPTVSWYAVYHFVIIWFANSVIGRTLYKVGFKKNISLCKMVLSHCFLYVSFFLASTILIHFEVTAAMIGTAGIVLVLGIDVKNDKKICIFFETILSIVCLLLCYIQQFNAFYVICCYLLVAFVYQLGTGFLQKNIKQVGVYLLTFLLVFSPSVFLVNRIEATAKSTEAWKSYQQYNKYRVNFWDYPHKTYEDDPALFEEIGWSEEFYHLTESMYFMDERFSKENLSKIVGKFSWVSQESLNGFGYTWKESLKSLFKSEGQTVIHIGIIFLLFLAFLWHGRSKELWKKKYPLLFAGLSCILGTAIVISFLAARGRLPLRAWLACFIPCGTILGILYLQLPSGARKTRPQQKYYKYTVILPLLLVWGVGLGKYYYELYNNEWMYRQTCVERISQIEAYAISHADNIYIFDSYGAQNYGVFTKYSDSNNRPINLIPWGSSYLFTPTYYEQLSAIGKTSLWTENFYDEDVYYITAPEGKQNYKNLLSDFLNKEYGNTEFEEIDKIGDVAVVYRIKMAN